MKPVAKQIRHRKAFTIVELLTVMSIIVILIGLMVPALQKVRRFARDVEQKAQFNAMSAAIELFNNEQSYIIPVTTFQSLNPGDDTGGVKVRVGDRAGIQIPLSEAIEIVFPIP